MQLSQVDLNLLVVFDAIFSEGGITRAANKLHLTQPTISHALGRLRALFGDPLFVRDGRQMVPTPTARNLAEPLRRALRGLEVTLNELDAFDPATAHKRFCVAMPDALESLVLPPLMAGLQRVAPGIDFAAVRVARRELESELAAGHLDAALDVPFSVPDVVRKRRLTRDPLVVVGRRGHRALKRRLTLERYLAEGHILVSSRRSGPGLEDVELGRHGLKRQIRLRCQHAFAACRVASETDLLVTMSASYARVINDHFGNRIAPLPLEMPLLDVYLYWHASQEEDAANRWLRAQLFQAFGRPHRGPA